MFDPFLYIINKIYSNSFVSIFHYVNCIIFVHVPKRNSIITSFNGSNSNIIKIYNFLHLIMTTIANIWFIFETNIFKIPIMTNITFFLVFFLLISIPCEISIPPYSNIYNSYKHSSKKIEDNTYHPLDK